MRHRSSQASDQRFGKDADTLQRRSRQDARHIRSRQRGGSNRKESQHILHVLGTECNKEDSQAKGEERHLRTDVQLDAPFRLFQTGTLEDEHDGYGRQDDALSDEQEGSGLSGVASPAGNRQWRGIHSLPDVDGCDGSEA